MTAPSSHGCAADEHAVQHPALSLFDLVDGLAARTGSWVVVEHFGRVLCHGTGGFVCPLPLVDALLDKSTAPLRAAVTWSRSGRLVRGSLSGAELLVAELGDGAAAWFVGGNATRIQEAVPMLAAAVHAYDVPVHDAVVEELLHPRGPTRPGQAPPALLLLLRAETSTRGLAHAAVTAAIGHSARVHVEDDTVVVALPTEAEPGCVVQHVRAQYPSVVGGFCRVGGNAHDWVAAARLAHGCLLAAQALGSAMGDPSDPAIAAELVVREAREAVRDLVRVLPDQPLQRLREHDDKRGSGELAASVTAWCRAGFDVPAAAAILHVHANTLRYRVKRAGELSGLDLSNPRQLLALQLLLDA